MLQRITPKWIKKVGPNEIFVFGSNLSGIHGAGAAKQAMEFGAIWGKKSGIQGNSYAIPTKDESVRHALKISEIKVYVDEFVEFAKNNPNLIFYVTEIGCGLAGFKPVQIRPLFENAKELSNVYLPERFLLK